ncbi:MAG TPA: hypothetical protein VGM51_13845 [Armatimonadota bacterium]|jgi:hypothetical protein
MLTVAHVLVGGTIGNEIRRARYALPLAFLSHYALDTVPHWSNWAVFFPTVANQYSAEVIGAVVDVTLAAGLILASTRGRANRALILSSAVFAAAPDVDNLPIIGTWMRASPATARIVAFHHNIQTNIAPSQWLLGAGPLALIGALAWWSFRRSGRMNHGVTESTAEKG